MDVVNSFVAWGFSVFSRNQSDSNFPVSGNIIPISDDLDRSKHTHKVYSSAKALESRAGWQLPNGVIATEFTNINSEGPSSKYDDLKYEGTIDYQNTKMINVEPTTKEGKENEERKIRWMKIDSQAEEQHVAPYENRRVC